MMPPPPAPPQWDHQGKDATRAFLSGFAGCLGVGLAVVFAGVVLLLLVLFLH